MALTHGCGGPPDSAAGPVVSPDSAAASERDEVAAGPEVAGKGDASRGAAMQRVSEGAVWMEPPLPLLDERDPLTARLPTTVREPRGGQLQRSVRAFLIDVREVTVGEYRACVASGACDTSGLLRPDAQCTWYESPQRDELREELPVSCVDHEQATAYCAHAGKRLPTEAEWLRAARGDSRQPYPWGRQPPSEDRACVRRWGPCRAGRTPFDVSPFGVRDLAGNVSEWTSTRCDRGGHVVRGSDYRDEESYRGALRLRSCEGERFVVHGRLALAENQLEVERVGIGFRCATHVPEDDPSVWDLR